jgi:hypothetical protein
VHRGGYPLHTFRIQRAGVSFKCDFLLVQIPFILSQIVTGWHPLQDIYNKTGMAGYETRVVLQVIAQ